MLAFKRITFASIMVFSKNHKKQRIRVVSICTRFLSINHQTMNQWGQTLRDPHKIYNASAS